MSIASDNTFTETRDQIINDAYIILGVSPDQQQISNNEDTYAQRTLNRMILTWQCPSMHLWLKTEAILFMQKGQNEYSITNFTSGDNCTNTWVEATLAVAGAIAATTVTCSSVTGMSEGDNIGIILDSGTTQWTTISSINTVTMVVTLSAALTGTAAAGNFLHTYTNRILRPIRILQARRYLYQSANDIITDIIPRETYFSLPDKTNQGEVTQIFYDPQQTTGKLYTWATPQDSSWALKFTYIRQINDFVNSTDTPDLPQEWLQPIVYNLAVLLAPSVGKLSKVQELQPLAEKMYMDLLRFDTEYSWTQFKPQNARY